MNIPFCDLQNIALIRRNGFGDVLSTLPAIHLLRTLAPQAKIHLFVEKNTFELAPFLQGPDCIWQIPTSSNKYGEIAKTVWRHRKTPFDLCISGKTTPMRLMNVFLAAFRSPYRLAYATTSWDRHLINCPRPWTPDPNAHQALRLMQLIDPSQTHIPTTWYPALKNVHPISRPDSLFVSVSNNRIGNILAIDRLANCLNQTSFSIAISALSKDAAKAQELAQKLKRPYELFIELPFPDFLGLILGVRGLLAADGGVVHLAAALNKQQVALYAGNSLSQWRPLNEKAICLHHPHHIDSIPIADLLTQLEKI